MNNINSSHSSHNHSVLKIGKRKIGFGEYKKTCSHKLFRQAKILHVIAVGTLIAGAAAVASAGAMLGLVSAGVILVPAAVPGVLTLGATALFVAAAVASILTVLHKRYLERAVYGVLNEVAKNLTPTKRLGENGLCESITCDNTIESYQWKKKLIESAEQNIVMSGNYCGGESFNEILDLMEAQLANKPALKIVLLSSDRFINEDNWRKVRVLTRDYPNRFQLIESPDIVHINPGIKKTTNHTKVLTIDYGKYFMQGGSGIDDRYTREDGLSARKNTAPNSPPRGFVESFLPDGFRDQDFVFHSAEEHGVGRLVYQESLKLALRWEGLIKKKSFDPKMPAEHNFAFLDSVAKDLLLAESKDIIQQQPTTIIPEFHASDKLSQGCEIKILTTGPEHTHNSFEDEIVERFDDARGRIIIDHLYFHPTKRVRDALIRAANRGVHITIITNGYEKANSPWGHMFFGPRNRYNYVKLVEATKPELRQNIQVFEYKVPNKALHKKVVVVDDYVIAGSSNLGYKSLVTMSDHEMNFISKGQAFADEVARVAFEQDAKVDTIVNGQLIEGPAKKIEVFHNSFRLHINALRHLMLAPIIG